MSRMTDAQFERMYKLLRLCEKKRLDMGLRHRIAIEVSRAEDVDLQLQLFEQMVTRGKIPATKGIPKEISLLSDGRGYGPIPAEDAEVIQRVTIDHRGNVHITYYDHFEGELRREQLQISPVTAAVLMQEINTTFAVRIDEERIPDCGMWALKITNEKGKTFSFEGPVHLDWRSPLTNLSENLRDALDRPMLLGFDGNAEEKYQFVSVCFDFAGKEYCYLAEDRGLAVGDLVEVPVGEHGRRSTATIVEIEYCTEDNAPYPLELTKHIIGKVEPDLPVGLDGPLFVLVKCVVDALDPEGLLAMDAPPDEYDGESLEIANSLKPDMGADEIAGIMAEKFSQSFGSTFDPNYFMVAAVRIKEALEVQNKKECNEEAKNV